MNKIYILSIVLIISFITSIELFSQEKSELYFDNSFLQAKEIYLERVLSDSLHPNFNNPDLDINAINKIKDQMNLVDEFLSSNDSFRHLFYIKPLVLTREKHIYINATSGYFDISKNKKGKYTKLPKELTAFMNNYDFESIELVKDNLIGNYYKIETKKEYNLSVLARELRKLDFIEWVDYSIGARMGYDKEYDLKQVGNNIICTISIGWGDCPSGCIYGRYWEFILSNDVVRLSRIYGSGTNSKYINKEDCFSYANISNLFIENNEYKEKKIDDSLFYSTDIRSGSIYLLNENLQALDELELGFEIDKIIYNPYLNSIIGISLDGELFNYELDNKKLKTIKSKFDSKPVFITTDKEILIVQYENDQVHLLNIQTLEEKVYECGGGIRVDTMHNFIQTIYKLDDICSSCLIRYNGINIDSSDYILKPEISLLPAIENPTYLTGRRALYKIEMDTIINVGERIKGLYEIDDMRAEIKMLGRNIAAIKSKDISYVFNLKSLKRIYVSEPGAYLSPTKIMNEFNVFVRFVGTSIFDDQGNEVSREYIDIQNQCEFTSYYSLTKKNTGVIELSKWEHGHFVSMHGLDTNWVDSKPQWLRIHSKSIKPYSSYDWPEEDIDKYNAFCELSNDLIFLKPKIPREKFVIVDKKVPKNRLYILPLPNGLLIYDDKHFTALGERCSVTIPQKLIETDDLLKQKFGIESTFSFE